jgi:hypothetical protein
MSSTNKTTNLGLNNWIETDRPKRTDFVLDNNIIDTALGNHIKDNQLHLTAEEKQRVTAPFSVFTVYGTGESTVELTPGFNPSMAIVCKKGAPFCVTENGVTKVNAGIVTSGGTSGGLSISNNSVMLEQSSSAVDGVYYNLNEHKALYLAVVFR